MLQKNTIIETTRIGINGNGFAVRANIVARGLQLGMRKRHLGKPLSDSCRPYCDWSTSSRSALPEVEVCGEQAVMERPTPAAEILPASAWATLVVQRAVTA